MTGILIVALAVLNVLLIFLVTAAPIGLRTTTVSRTIRASRSRLWEALWPLGSQVTWENKIIRAEPSGDGQALLEYSWPDRAGQPIKRLAALEDVTPGQEFTMRIVEDSSLAQSFWTDFRETTVLDDHGDGTVTVTVSITDKYRGLAYPVFRFFSLRRSTGRLKAWAETGRFNRTGIFEHPLTQFGFAGISTLLLWPFFGLSKFGFLLAGLLTLVVAFHELGHMAAFRMMGHKSTRMIFIPILGGIAIGGRPYDTRYEIAFVALMGAGFSALLVLAAIFGSHIAEMSGYRNLGATFAVFAGFCAIFNLANLVPVWKFDGGQVLRQLFRQQGSLMVASATTFACLFAIGIFAGISVRILLVIGAIFAALSVLTSNAGVKPRHEIKPMTPYQQLAIVAGFFSIFAVHSGGVLWAVRLFFG